MADKPSQETKKPAKAAKSSNKTVWIVVGVVVAIFIIIPAILFAAGLAFVKHSVDQNGIKVDTHSDSVSIQDKNGNQVTAGGSKTLPKDFPSSVSVYKGTIIATARITTDGKVSWSASVTTKDSADKVASSLASTFGGNGWTTDINSQTNDGGLVVAHNDKYQVNVPYSSKDGTTTLVYTVVSKQ